MVPPIARPIGDGGVSTISNAAGRKASSSVSRRLRVFATSIAALADFMNSTLQTVERRIAAAPGNEIVMNAVLDEAAMVERQDAIGKPNRR